MDLEILSLPTLIVGTLLWGFGWVLYRMALVVAGGVLGAAAGLGVALGTVMVFGLADTHATVALAAGGILGAIAGYLLFQMLHALAFFLSGAVLGGVAYFHIITLLEQHVVFHNPGLMMTIGIPASAVVCGLLTWWLSRYFIATASALLGTILILSSLGWPYSGLPALAVFPLGMMIQLRFGRGRHHGRIPIGASPPDPTQPGVLQARGP